jgi:2-polyprenyl-6-methoxyphenol hydroxylase-like FAD-dependent oxidoreductase
MDMAEKQYDAIVVGARCAGSPTAMLLARKGYKVLVVDRATFPSDTISTHIVHTPGVAALDRWGLLGTLVASGCPPLKSYDFDFGPFTISGSPATDEARVSYCPRRTVLDSILVDAAAEAGAEVREGFTVEEIVTSDGRVTGIRGHGKDGKTVTESASVVIGADGRHSVVAKDVGAEKYDERPVLQDSYYTYWSGLPAEGFGAFIRPNRGFALVPTNDDLAMLVVGWPHAEFDANRKDVEGTYLKTLELVPDVAERVRGAKREAKFVGAGIENFFRKPYGPGWALVGDAGYIKDPITAQGITDAFRDVEVVADALDETFSGARSFDDAMADYQSARDKHVYPMYEFTQQLASLQPPPPEIQQVLGAVAQSQESMDGFARMAAGATSPAEFLSEENIAAIMARAGAGMAK